MKAGRGLAAALLLFAAPVALAQPPAPVAASRLHFAPPVDTPLTWRVTTRRVGRDGAPISFSSIYSLRWSRAGRGYRLDATLLRIESDARPEILRALTAVLQPLVGQPVTYLVAGDGRSVALADSEALWAGVIARTEAVAADASRPEAKAVAALLRALPPEERDALAAADIRALVAPANPALTRGEAGQPVTATESETLPDGESVEIDRLWQVDPATGLVVREEQKSWMRAPGDAPRTLVEERVRTLLSS